MAIQSGSDVAVLCDFDGTATQQDVLGALYRKFADSSCWDLIEQRSREEITSREVLQACFRSMNASRAEMEAVLDAVSLDPAFPGLREFCRERDYRFAIVSNGLSWYIHYVLDRYGIDDVPVYANEIHFEPAGIRLSFPWYHPESPLLGTSKSTIVRGYQNIGYKVVFVGDGRSDYTAVEVADVVYARNGLAAYCRERDIAVIEISNLSDFLAKWVDP